MYYEREELEIDGRFGGMQYVHLDEFFGFSIALLVVYLYYVLFETSSRGYYVLISIFLGTNPCGFARQDLTRL